MARDSTRSASMAKITMSETQAWLCVHALETAATVSEAAGDGDRAGQARDLARRLKDKLERVDEKMRSEGKRPG